MSGRASEGGQKNRSEVEDHREVSRLCPDPKPGEVLSGDQKFESPIYLVKPSAGFVIS